MNIRVLFRRRFRLFDNEALARLRGPDVYEELMQFLKSCLQPIGWNVMKIPFVWSWRTSMSVAVIVTYTLGIFYTTAMHWGDWFQVIDTLTLAGLACSTIMKLIVSYQSIDYFQWIYTALKVMYDRNVNHKQNNRDLVFNCTLISYLFRFISVIYVIAGVGYSLPVIYMYVRFKKLTLMMNLHFPGIDAGTLLGYVLTSIIQGTILTVGFPGIIASDLGTMNAILHMMSIASIFNNALKELDVELSRRVKNKIYIHKKLMDIAIMHQEIINYEEELDSVYGRMILAQVVGSTIGMALSLFSFYMTQNISSLTLLMASFFQLLEFCTLGTTLTVQNDQIMRALYDLRWYELSISDQKLLNFILHRSQNAVEMTVGGLALLNIGTFVQIMKTIYSYFAMLIQFLG